MQAWESESIHEFLPDDEGVREHAGIRAFVSLCENARGGDVLTFEAIQERPFIPYWKSMGILKWDAVLRDFIFVFYGTGVSALTGCDFTGRGLSEGDPRDAPIAQEIHRRALFDRQVVYFSGSLGWRDRSHVRYAGVAMPLRRENALNETVSLICKW